MKNFDYLEPTTVGEACALLKQHGADAKVYAGGTHLTILMKQGLYQPRTLVNIKKIMDLRGIDFDAERGLRLGALVTHRQLETSPIVRRHYPVLCEAEREVANIRVRNVGTIGGNLVSGEPLTDLSQIFIALDGSAEVIGPGSRRRIALEELFVDFYQTSLKPDEILTCVVLPPLPERTGVEYIRFSSSSAVDKPTAGVAVRIALEPERDVCGKARVVLGCVGPTPVRARRAEALLNGNAITPPLAEQAGASAAQECSPLSDLRGSEPYKRAIVKTLVKRAVAKAYERGLRPGSSNH